MNNSMQYILDVTIKLLLILLWLSYKFILDDIKLNAESRFKVCEIYIKAVGYCDHIGLW